MKNGKTNIKEVKSMILVLFLFILIILLLFIFFTYIKVDLDDVFISNIPKFHYDFKIKIGLYLFGKVKILGFKIDKEKLKTSKLINKMEAKMKKEKLGVSLNDSIKIIKKAEIELEKFKLDIKLGTEDVIITSALVGFLSSIIGIILGRAIKHYEEEKYKYIILPHYTKKNIFEMRLDCIINAKLVHIIYVIYMFSRKRSENNYERTSNRRAYDYSYE